MIWVIYRQKSTFGGPKAIPFENDSKDIAISELGDINENS